MTVYIHTFRGHVIQHQRQAALQAVLGTDVVKGRRRQCRFKCRPPSEFKCLRAAELILRLNSECVHCSKCLTNGCCVATILSCANRNGPAQVSHITNVSLKPLPPPPPHSAAYMFSRLATVLQELSGEEGPDGEAQVRERRRVMFPQLVMMCL